jgi:hypothetical protein
VSLIESSRQHRHECLVIKLSVENSLNQTLLPRRALLSFVVESGNLWGHMSKTLLIVGELMLLLGVFIALWDIHNEFLLLLLAVGLVCLGIGLAFE